MPALFGTGLGKFSCYGNYITELDKWQETISLTGLSNSLCFAIDFAPIMLKYSDLGYGRRTGLYKTPLRSLCS